MKGALMKAAISVGKVVVLLFWGAVVVSLFPLFPTLVSTILRWAGAFVLLAHFIEMIIITRYLRDHVAEPKLNKLTVLVFGLFYVVPFMQKAE